MTIQRIQVHTGLRLHRRPPRDQREDLTDYAVKNLGIAIRATSTGRVLAFMLRDLIDAV